MEDEEFGDWTIKCNSYTATMNEHISIGPAVVMGKFSAEVEEIAEVERLKKIFFYAPETDPCGQKEATQSLILVAIIVSTNLLKKVNEYKLLEVVRT